MYCPNCGIDVGESKFCSECGTKINSNISKISVSDSGVKFVPAKCTNCGGALQVNPTQEAAICPFCNQPYIIEKAINNYKLSVSGNVIIEKATLKVEGSPSINNLLERAKVFEKEGDIETAKVYYNRVLDMDINNSEANLSINRLNSLTYASVEANHGFSSGVLELKKDYLIFTSKKGKESKISLYDIVSVGTSIGCLSIKISKTNYFMKSKSNPNGNVELSFALVGKHGITKDWIGIINNARNGTYPLVHVSHDSNATSSKNSTDYVIGGFALSQEQYNQIFNLCFSTDKVDKIKAVKILQQYTGSSLAQAKNAIDTLVENANVK